MDFETPQARQFGQLVRELAEKSSGRFDALDKQVRGAVGEIAKLRDDFASVQSRYRERFNAIADGHQRGGFYKGSWRDAQQAKAVGQFFANVLKKRADALEQFHAAVSGETGESGAPWSRRR